jgi:pimeloyl-ACP methyl ester carboxylesterase
MLALKMWAKSTAASVTLQREEGDKRSRALSGGPAIGIGYDQSWWRGAPTQSSRRPFPAYTTESMQTANDRGLGGVTEDEVQAIKAPTLLIWGVNDPLSSVANADKLNATIKNSRKVLFEKAGHYPFLEHADKFNRLVLEFLKSQS